jgi:hypothetical protein
MTKQLNKILNPNNHSEFSPMTNFITNGKVTAAIIAPNETYFVRIKTNKKIKRQIIAAIG